ncbi:unnamed protein product [Staurois parvus]|uniref:Uncharacterized protein n=1 Tax=Staurois parvus TaxID=386267 RepID=A0ABN9FR58_9NEOB|nr:unnamed protein product [Staurois parvus]
MGPYIPPPHAAARPLICHGPLYTASSCCCQAPNLPWAPIYRLLMLLPSPESVMGPLYGLPLLLSPSPHSAMCHFQVSSHTAGVLNFFDIGCWQITGLP